MNLRLPLLLAMLWGSIDAVAAQPPDSVTASEAALRNDPLLLTRSAVGEAQPLVLDLLLGRVDAAQRLERWLAEHPEAAASARADIWALLCEERHRHMRYRDAIAACRQAETIRPGIAAGFLGLIEPLRDLPPMRWNVDGLEVPLIKDDDGTRRVQLADAAGPLDAIVDTGAELTVMSESVARRFGARRLGGSSVATTTTPIAGGIAVVDLAIGAGRLSNVPVMVLPDQQMILPDGTRLPTILSLGALTAAGRAAFLGHGTRLALGRAVPEVVASRVRLYWDPSGIGFAARFARGERAVHLDTGSGRDYLFPTALGSLSEAEVATRQPFERRLIGLGGEQVEQASRFARISLDVAGQSWTFAPMEMAPEDGEGEAARIGVAIMDRFETVVLDFETMEMAVR